MLVQTPSPAPLPLVITRPAPQAQAWCTALQKHLPTHPCIALPLIEIAPNYNATAQQTLQNYLQALRQYHAAMFVSPAAVQHFFAAPNSTAQLWAEKRIRAWAVGNGTQQALLQAGVPEVQIDSPDPRSAQFDSETLWQKVSTQLPGCKTQEKKILIVRGTDTDNAKPASLHALTYGSGREWLRHTIAQAGVHVDSVAVYCRQTPHWDEPERKTALQLTCRPSVWLLSSSAAIRHLAQLLPSASFQNAIALCTHPRIAQTAAQHGFGRVMQTRPELADIAQAVQTMHLTTSATK